MYPLIIDLRDKAIKAEKEALENYITQLKRQHRRYAKFTFESKWPPIVAKFTDTFAR